MHRPALVLLVVALAAGCGATDEPADGTATASVVAVPSPASSPSSSQSPDASPSDEPVPSETDPDVGTPPTATASETADDGSDEEPAPPSLAAFAGVDVPRIVVEDGDWYWARVGGGEWRAVALVEETFVVGDGRWLVEWASPDPGLRAVDAPDVTCTPPEGFLDVELDWAVIHEQDVTSVFVEQADGSVASVVCEDPSRDPPVEWTPAGDLGDGQFGPITLVDDGITLVLEGDAEGNVTVYDETGEVELIPYAISGPFADAARGILVYVAQEGGMHFAGGTLVVTDLDGQELERVDLGGTSILVGLVDGSAVVERVDVVADFTTTAHLLVDLATGEIVAEAPTDVRILYVGD